MKLICDGKSLSKPSVADQLTVFKAAAAAAAALAGGSGIKVVVVAAAKPCSVARRSRGCSALATVSSTAAAARCLMFATRLQCCVLQYQCYHESIYVQTQLGVAACTTICRAK
mmetsp:Transcript_4251/g.12409  ORF Transcript_4251/g.12409 Transcript_4251/m.12409 type:complete len:113 (-) Transcript_4251:36-374(-)